MPAQYGLGTEKPTSCLRWLYLPFMLLLALGCMVLATQRIAAYFAYQEALGTPLGFALGMPWYAPWAVFGWYETFRTYDAYGFMEQAVKSGPVSCSPIPHSWHLAQLSQKNEGQCQSAWLCPLGYRT